MRLDAYGFIVLVLAVRYLDSPVRGHDLGQLAINDSVPSHRSLKREFLPHRRADGASQPENSGGSCISSPHSISERRGKSREWNARGKG